MVSISMFSLSRWSSITRHNIRSYDSNIQVDEELTNLKTWELAMSRIPDAETFGSGLACLERLYTCADNLLSLPLTQHAFSNYQHHKLVDELLVRSMRLLDSCGTLGDVVSQVKKHVRDIQSAQRRGKEVDLIIDSSLVKKLNKDAKKAVGDFKQIDLIYASKPLILEHHLSSVIKVLRDVSEVSISMFGFLLSFLTLSITKLKSESKWSTVLKLMQKETGTKYPSQICVEALDSHVEGIEIGLTSMFRNLMKTRASILNIKSL